MKNLKDKKQIFVEFAEVIDATGQENEKKAAKWVKEIEAEKEKRQLEEELKQKEFLEDNRRKKSTYNRVLAGFLTRMVIKIDTENKYELKVDFDELGVLVKLYEGGKLKGRRAFKSTGEVNYDFYAAFVLAIQAENTIDRLLGKLVSAKENKSGIILPHTKVWKKQN